MGLVEISGLRYSLVPLVIVLTCRNVRDNDYENKCSYESGINEIKRWRIKMW